jgi:hypothetical protein
MGFTARFRSILLGLLFVVGFLLSFQSWIGARFANWVATSLVPIPTERKPLSQRVVLMILDDTGYEAAAANLQGVFGMARERGWVRR